ncbi:MAG: helix-turn-helix domain-containing protein [Halioglobus sp.]|nr:helix-turn-helix domain-containing protein [Halioglobus sp.]
MAETARTANTREQILEAAENLFASQGYQATTIKQVAGAVGIRGPAIYKHFDSKRALFEAVLEGLFAPFLALMDDEAAAGGNLDGVVAQHLGNPNASRIVQHATLSGGEDLALLVERWYLPFFHDVRELAATEGEFSPVVVMAFHSMLLGYLTLAPLHQAIFEIDPLSADAVGEMLRLQSELVAQLAART